MIHNQDLTPPRNNQDLTPLRSFAAVLTGAALVWIVVLVGAPLLLDRGLASSAVAALYGACGLICHQQPARSFAISGVHLPVCARCFGLYAAAAVGALAVWVTGTARLHAGSRHLRLALAIAATPTAATIAIEWLGIALPTNTMRAAAAIPLGVAAGWICVRLLVDESRERGHEWPSPDARPW